MSPTARNTIIAVAAVAALAAGYATSRLRAHPAPGEGVESGRLPDVALADIDGKPHKLAEWKGKVLVLNFWASWCPPCREEIPLLQSAHQRYEPQGLAIVGLAIDQLGSVAAFRKQAGITYPILVDDAAVPLMSFYGDQSGSLPFTVVLDRAGHVVARKLGAFHGDELEQIVKPLLTGTISSN
jgi:thiol-disulfide isomerase/thioredoxin